MASGATKWAWENSRASNGSLIVLLAIAHECGEGEFTEMRIADLATKSRLSDRAVRMAVKDLEALGELSVEAARGSIGRYAPRQYLPDTPADIAGPAKSAPRQILPDPLKEPQVKVTPAISAGPQIPDALDLGSVVSGGKSRAKKVSDAPRPDVERICRHLADRIEGNGSKRPAIGKRWRDSARLLIDKDGLTEQQITDAIDWCQKHHFWHRQILSMEKLRFQMDRLRLDWKAERDKASTRRPQGGRPNPDDDYAEALVRIQARKETANGTGRDRDNRPAGEIGFSSAAD